MSGKGAPGTSGLEERIANAKQLVFCPVEAPGRNLLHGECAYIYKALYDAADDLRVLAAFARTAPGRLPHEVQQVVNRVQWDSPAIVLNPEGADHA